MKFLQKILLAVHVITIALLLGTVLNKWIPPSFSAKLNLLSLAFPILMIANGMLLLVWLLWRKKEFIIFLVLTLLMINPVRRWINFIPKDKSNNTIKILSFNVHITDENQRKKIESFLNNSDYDLIMLQEAGAMKPKTNLPYSYTEEMLLATYSKFEIIEKKPIHRFNKYDPPCAIQTDVIINKKRIRIINVHLTSFMFSKRMLKPAEDMDANEQKALNAYSKLTSAFRSHEIEVQKIREVIQSSPYPVILCGDFNSVPNSYEYYNLSEGLNDAFLQAGNGSATSFHDYKFPIRIDYIFISKKMKSKDYQVDRNVKFSDHFPVSAKIKL